MRHISDLNLSKKELNLRAEFYFGEHLRKTFQKGNEKGHLDFRGSARVLYIFD